MEEKENLEKLEKEDIINESTSPEEATDGPEGEPSMEETKIEELSVEDKLSAENQELKDKYLRLYSEFENYRRRTAKERLDLIKTASEGLVLELLPVVDDFER